MSRLGHEPADGEPLALRTATDRDVGAVARLVDEAYQPYVRELGVVPGPMRLNYSEVVATRTVILAETDGELVGLVVLDPSGDELVIENVAVLPSRQGGGIGRRLLDHAEATAARAGQRSIALYTHGLMSENLAWYGRSGYHEYRREALPDGSELVHLRKRL